MGAGPVESHVATRKVHRCDECGLRIPIGARYWYKKDGKIREHTNCEDFKKEPPLPPGFNNSRKAFRDIFDTGGL